MPAVTSARLLAWTTRFLQDQAGTVASADVESSILGAVSGFYTRYFPNRRSRLLRGTGTRLQTIPPLLTTAVRERPHVDSVITRIEYPVGSTTVRPGEIAFSTWRLYPYNDPMADAIEYDRTYPANGEDYRVEYDSIHKPQLATPAAPTAVYSGAVGGASYAYKVVAVDGSGTSPASSASATIINCGGTLSAADFVTITWLPVPNAWSYRIYLTTATGSGHTTGLLGTVTDGTQVLTATGTMSFVHNGQDGDGTTAPTSNTSETTTAIEHDEPIGCWAAAGLLRSLASFHSGNKDNRLKGRGGWGGMDSKFEGRAKELEARAYAMLGIDPNTKVKAAAVTMRMDPGSTPGVEPLYESIYGGYDEEPLW